MHWHFVQDELPTLAEALWKTPIASTSTDCGLVYQSESIMVRICYWHHWRGMLEMTAFDEAMCSRQHDTAGYL